MGDPWNTAFLDLDITDSPCGNTNHSNRFEITNEAQLSVAIAAAMADKQVTSIGIGSCNSADIESISVIRISP